MRTTFKKYFIPHEGKEHRPHLLRWEAMLALASVALVFEILFLAEFWVLVRSPGLLAAILDSALVAGTNTERAAMAAPPLPTTAILSPGSPAFFSEPVPRKDRKSVV